MGFPKKRLGQHFLKDPNTARIVASGVTKEDVVLEVGPGRGFLTAVLAERARLVHAVELDPHVLPDLRHALEGRDSVTIYEGDALTFDYSTLDPTPNKLAANLPYNVASPLVLRLLEEAPFILSLRFMVQLEVARRMAAARGTKDYAAYAVLVQLLAKASIQHKVSPQVFDPPPRVYSAVVALDRRESVSDRAEYEGVKKLVLAAFKSRRKKTYKQSLGTDSSRNSAYPDRVGVRPRCPGGGAIAGRLRSALPGIAGGSSVKRILLRAFAKINYALEVKGLLSDGYHEVATVLQSISLADALEVERAGEGFGLHVEPRGAHVGPPEQNTVYKAWSLLGEAHGGRLPVRVRLDKKIPSGAGLGGASADAAAFLVGANELFQLGMDLAGLHKIGAAVGADVPFCISGGTALGEGMGEILTTLPAPPDHQLVVVKPEQGADTARIYRAYDKHTGRGIVSVKPIIDALRAGDLPALAASVANDLSPVTRKLIPDVAACESNMIQAGALGATMSGSGSSVFGIFEDEDAARMVLESLQAPFAGVYEPVVRGVEIVEADVTGRDQGETPGIILSGKLFSPDHCFSMLSWRSQETRLQELCAGPVPASDKPDWR